MGSIHISQVSAVVEGDNALLEELPKVPSNEADAEIAKLLMKDVYKRQIR